MNKQNDRPKVVFVGGGFGGLDAANGLGNRPVSITLVDRKNHHTFQPLLYWVSQAYCYSPSSRITRQGFPTANTPSGMSLVTTLPAPITERAPTLTPGQMIAPPPTHTSSPTSTALPDSRPVLRSAALSGWVAA